MKIAIIGSRGIPANYGGFETFSEKISEVLKKDNKVLVVGDVRNLYSNKKFNGIYILNSKYDKARSPIRFYHESIKIANNWGADIAVMCGTGGIFSFPLFLNSKMKIYVNPDGLEYKRPKWNLLIRLVLLFQTVCVAVFAKYIICDSKGISQFYKRLFKRSKNIFVAEYGTQINSTESNYCIDFENYFDKLKIKKNNYYLVVARIEPENNLKQIIEGYKNSLQKFPLIIVGNINTPYAKKLLYLASNNVRFIDGVYDHIKLSALRYYCKAYFHGHSVGGTNPSLLEAMGSENLVIAHDNVYNKEVLDSKAFFFSSTNDVTKIINVVENDLYLDKILTLKKQAFNRAKNYYTWNKVGKKYIDIFNKT